MKRFLWLTILAAGTASAQETAPPRSLPAVEGVLFEDVPADNGAGVQATWKKMPNDAEVTYKVLVALSEKGPWFEGGSTPGTESFTQDDGLPFWMGPPRNRETHYLAIDGYQDGENRVTLQPAEDPKKKTRKDTPDYWFKLVAEGPGGRWESPATKLRPEWNFFNWARLNVFIYMISFAGIILFFIRVARGRQLFIRRIAGLDAVDEAVGRATEMGKPIFYLTGRNGMTDVSTVAATLILGEIAKKVATYDTTIKVPHTDPIVMAVCQEITRESYIAAGRPDSFKPESNFFVTDDQFGYTAAVDGMMVREKPAACFYMGYYYAEALLLAETGASTGAIQVAGTDADHQLPFFVTACDYTLIGEELYAAGAYLSKEPVLVGTLRGQDVGKAVVLAALLILTAVATIGQWISVGGKKPWKWSELSVFDFLKGS
ncbi:MAG: hypothetical protein FD180_3852 [Planctomycetota bacterium]|nr:MAG: hypothetical protein FD180_3852 [Planctomycetota bacterium]